MGRRRKEVHVGFSTEAQYKKSFGPFTPGFRTVPYGDLGAVRKAVHKNTVGILVEPLQGEAGVIIPPEGFLRGLRDLATAEGVLLLAAKFKPD